MLLHRASGWCLSCILMKRIRCLSFGFRRKSGILGFSICKYRLRLAQLAVRKKLFPQPSPQLAYSWVPRPSARCCLPRIAPARKMAAREAARTERLLHSKRKVLVVDDGLVGPVLQRTFWANTCFSDD